MAKNFVYIGIVVLAFIAIVLGYKIYQQQLALKTEIPLSNQQGQKKSASPINSTLQPTATQSTAVSQNIDLDAIFKQFPGPNATVEEIQKFRDYIYSIGKETGLITIRDCKADPLVFRVKKSQDFKITNEDNVDHRLTMQSIEVVIKAKKTLTKKAAVEIGEIGYSCDTSPNHASVGIIQTVQ